jgi:predicted permease
MNRIALFIIRRATPPADREWVVGDTVEEFERVADTDGPAAAARWLRRETWRVLASAPGHRLVARRSARNRGTGKGDGAMRAGWQDFRYALRLLGKSPGFAVVAVFTLGLGIGANAAIFAVVDAVLLKPLPFKAADRLMLVHMTVPDREHPGVFVEQVWSYPKYRTLADTQQVFDDLALFSGRDFDLSGDGEPERVHGEVISDTYPAILGISPMMGRPFTHDEVHKAGAPTVAIIGHGLWTRRFGADPGAVGRTLRINGAPYTVVGVLPRGFRGLTGNAEAWVPLGVVEPFQLEQAQSHSYYIVARRKPEVAEAAAMAAVRVLGARVDAAHRRRDVGGAAWGASAASLYASRADVDVRRASFVLLGAVGFVLLIACVNLTNLVAARAVARRR